MPKRRSLTNPGEGLPMTQPSTTNANTSTLADKLAEELFEATSENVSLFREVIVSAAAMHGIYLDHMGMWSAEEDVENREGWPSDLPWVDACSLLEDAVDAVRDQCIAMVNDKIEELLREEFA